MSFSIDDALTFTPTPKALHRFGNVLYNPDSTKYEVSFRYKKVRYCLGEFDSAETAHAAYVSKYKQLVARDLAAKGIIKSPK